MSGAKRTLGIHAQMFIGDENQARVPLGYTATSYDSQPGN